MKFDAVITEDLISTGVRNSCSNCPLAIAIRHAVPGAECVDVNSVEFSFLYNGKSYEGRVPATAQRWMENFDTPVKLRRAPPEPTCFSLVARRSVA